MTTEKLQVLEKLVEELLKDVPEESVVKACMVDAGLEYNRDPIDRINKVLTVLHFEESKREFKE